MIKKIGFVAAAIVLLFAGCNRNSPVQSYRFAGETESHSFQVHFDWWTSSYNLIADGKLLMEDFENGSQTTWNNKKVSTQIFMNAGLVFVGAKTSILVFVDNEKISQFDF